MFYRPGLDPHGLPHNPFKALVAPRPIGWISTLDAEGRRNLAPYSFFNAFSDTPPMVGYASTGAKASGERKDTLANIRATGEFVVNIVSYALRDAMNASSAPLPAEADELPMRGLPPRPARRCARHGWPRRPPRSNAGSGGSSTCPGRAMRSP